MVSERLPALPAPQLHMPVPPDPPAPHRSRVGPDVVHTRAIDAGGGGAGAVVGCGCGAAVRQPPRPALLCRRPLRPLQRSVIDSFQTTRGSRNSMTCKRRTIAHRLKCLGDGGRRLDMCLRPPIAQRLPLLIAVIAPPERVEVAEQEHRLLLAGLGSLGPQRCRQVGAELRQLRQSCAHTRVAEDLRFNANPNRKWMSVRSRLDSL